MGSHLSNDSPLLCVIDSIFEISTRFPKLGERLRISINNL
ncbi:protein of unknown function [Xenorhabdus poinarii G6]|uniref:Uncharacterized protein n=1 Tax=Xenorhabdus poinarii G6 TaxID=1354304 RepID=A0A068R5V4_9GAMM|nr:protein of unknown function [Xenorhabdus poinarii G6]